MTLVYITAQSNDTISIIDNVVICERPIDFRHLEWDISDNNKPELDNVASFIRKYGKGYRIKIKVHSNDYKSSRRNVKISKRRAQAVYDYLISLEPSLRNQLILVPLGDESLLYPECDSWEKCKKEGNNFKNEANNRVVFEWIKK